MARVPGDAGRAFFLTSRPYPIEDIASLELTPSYIDSALYRVVEAVDLAMTIVEIARHTLIVEYDDGAEAVDVSATFGEAVIHTVLVAYDDGAEAIDLTGGFVGAVLNDALVRTTMAPEGMDMSGSFISAVLA